MNTPNDPAGFRPDDEPRDPHAAFRLPDIGQAGADDGLAHPWSQSLVDEAALADMQAFNDLKAKRKRRRKKRILIGACSALAVVLIGAGAFAWYAADQANRAAQDMVPQVALVERGTYTETVSASGSLKPKASVSASPEVDGVIGEVFVAEGDAVVAGQPLYTIVNADLDKAVAQAQQGIDEAANGVTQAQVSLDDAYRAKRTGEEQAAAAQAAAARAAEEAQEAGEPAAAAGASASSGFDADSANSAIRQAELALNSANLGLQNAQAAYDEAVARAAKRTVNSSIDGSIIAVNIEPGKALASATGTVASPVQIADLSQMTVSIGVNEIDILKVSADQQASVTFTAAPDLELPAQVIRIATAATGSEAGGAAMGYGGGGVVTYAVDLLIAEPDPRLKPGMTAKASITTTTMEDALMVPISAVQTDGEGGSFVLVMTDAETMETKTVKVEVLASDGLTAVVEGLVKEGDAVAVSGGAMPADAMGAMGGSGDGAVVSDAGATEIAIG